MSVDDVIQITQHLLYTAMLLSLPAVAVSLVVGVIVSVLQTLFSVQEQTLSFAPRIVLVGAAMLLTLPWTLGLLMGFTSDTFTLMVSLVR